MRKIYIHLLLGVLVLLGACTSTTPHQTTLTFTTSADGPFFAGPNSLISTYEVNLNELIDGQQLTADQIAKVSLNKVTATIPTSDSTTVDNFLNATLQFVADDVPMSSIAVKNPIEGTGNSIELNASQEVDLSDFFKQKSFSVLLDWDFNEDRYAESLGTIVEMELTFEIKN